MHNETFYTTKNIKEIKLALLSDIHYYEGYNERIFAKLIKQIKKNKPDYITITGDILDTSNVTEFANLKEFLKQLADMAPTIVVIGNHDEKAGSMKNWQYNENKSLISLLKSIDNIYFLNDEIKQFDNISFYGFNLSYKYYEKDNEDYKSFCKEVKELKCNIPKDTYNITLFHSPINIYNFLRNNKDHNLANSDLILSGHMHNGCLPFIISHPINKIFKTSRSFFSPTREFFPKYAQGRVYERDGYIFEGISKLSHSTKLFHLFDIFFQKNVEFITIKKDQ